MKVEIAEENKKHYLDLLLLADEQESMIDKYLGRGTLFALYDGPLMSVCVVTDEGDGKYEIQNLATYEEHQRKGYGRYLIHHVCDYFKKSGTEMRVGTGDVPSAIHFYENSGFVISHRLKDFFVEHYDHLMFEDGIQLRDKVYLTRRITS